MLSGEAQGQVKVERDAECGDKRSRQLSDKPKGGNEFELKTLEVRGLAYLAMLDKLNAKPPNTKRSSSK